MIDSQRNPGKRKKDSEQGCGMEEVIQFISSEYTQKDNHQHLKPDTGVTGIILKGVILLRWH